MSDMIYAGEMKKCQTWCELGKLAIRYENAEVSGMPLTGKTRVTQLKRMDVRHGLGVERKVSDMVLTWFLGWVPRCQNFKGMKWRIFCS